MKKLFVLSLFIAMIQVSAFAVKVPVSVNSKTAAKLSFFEKKFLSRLPDSEKKEAILFIMELLGASDNTSSTVEDSEPKIIYVTNTVYINVTPTPEMERGRDHSRRGKRAMDSADFEDLLSSWKNATFNSDKIKVLETAIPRNNFSMNQLIQMTELYTFDDERLKIINLGYPRVVEGKSGAYKLLELFKYQSSKELVQKILDENP